MAIHVGITAVNLIYQPKDYINSAHEQLLLSFIRQKLEHRSFNTSLLALQPHPVQMSRPQRKLFVRSAINFSGQWFGPPHYMMGPMGPVTVPRPHIWFVLIGYNSQGKTEN